MYEKLESEQKETQLNPKPAPAATGYSIYQNKEIKIQVTPTMDGLVEDYGLLNYFKIAELNSKINSEHYHEYLINGKNILKLKTLILNDPEDSMTQESFIDDIDYSKDIPMINETKYRAKLVLLFETGILQLLKDTYAEESNQKLARLICLILGTDNPSAEECIRKEINPILNGMPNSGKGGPSINKNSAKIVAESLRKIGIPIKMIQKYLE